MGSDVKELKSDLYGVYQKQNDVDNNRNNARADWKDKTHQHVVAKSLDLAMTEGEGMGDVTANKTYNHQGLTWQHLAVIALAGISSFGIFKFAPQQQPIQPTVVQQPVPQINQPSPSPSNVGYTVEIRDPLTHQPIRVDWINGSPPKLNDSTLPIVPSK